jgi:hypothetical protein
MGAGVSRESNLQPFLSGVRAVGAVFHCIFPSRSAGGRGTAVGRQQCGSQRSRVRHSGPGADGGVRGPGRLSRAQPPLVPG